MGNDSVRSTSPQKTTDATRVTILLIVLESIAWSCEQWTQTHNGYGMIRFFLSACVYCFHPFIVVSIIHIITPLKKLKWLILPLCVYVGGSIHVAMDALCVLYQRGQHMG